MKKWYDEEYEFQVEVTGFLRGDHTERYCRNGEEVGDRYTCTMAARSIRTGRGSAPRPCYCFPPHGGRPKRRRLENVGGSGPYCKDIVCPDGCVLFA